MTCYKPRIRAEDRFKWEVALDGHRYHPATIFSTDRLEEYDHIFTAGHYKYEQIPCKECIGCRLDYSREWANRGYLESLQYDQNYFVTLTYDEINLPMAEYITTSDDFTYTELDEVPWQGTLIPKDLQDFMKRLRINMKRKYNQDEPIRFLACGEYGAKGKRPHYHLILFNLKLPAESFYEPRINWEQNTYFQNMIIEEAWDKGISNICEATWENIAYTARYITKKVNGKQSEHYYAIQGEVKEFFRASNQPGIARQYYEDHKHEIYKNDEIMIRNKKGVHYVKPPKYFDDLYQKEYPEEYEKIKKRRKKINLDRLIIKGKTTSLTRWEQLQIEQSTKEQTAKSLKRDLEG